MMRRLSGGAARPIRLADFSGYEAVVAFLVLWSPSLNRGRGRWQSWSAYLRSWNAVRGEFFERYPERRDAARWPFAERVRAYAARRGGVEALQDADLMTIKHAVIDDDAPSA